MTKEQPATSVDEPNNGTNTRPEQNQLPTEHSALILDIDGVVSPVHGHTAWGDDEVAGHVFGPVLVSPSMVARLDALALTPHLSCWWLTSWTMTMRRAMDPFPGHDWPAIPEPPTTDRRTWWKWHAVSSWLADRRDISRLAWCDDHLTPHRRLTIGRALEARGTAHLLIAPDTAVGLGPDHLVSIEQHLLARPA
jgi:hypothetical protein